MAWEEPEYFAPQTLAEAIALLNRFGEDAKCLAGGQSLLAMMNLGLARPRVLVDLGAIGDLRGIREEDDGIHIGAGVRYTDAASSPLIRSRIPLLVELIDHIGNVRVRNRGTIGGNVAHADPASEVPALLVALDGAAVAAGPSGVRTIPSSQFFLAPLVTALASDEILCEVVVPSHPIGAGWAFTEVSRRPGDFALAACVAQLQRSKDGMCQVLQMGLAGVGPTPMRVPEAEVYARGRPLVADTISEVAEIVRNALEPDSDAFVDAEYRRTLACVLVRRALAEAARRASALETSR